MKYLIFMLIVVSCLFIMISSVFHLFRIKGTDCPVFSWQHFFILVQVYFVVIFGFGVIYLGLDAIGLPSITYQDKAHIDRHNLYFIGNIIYFSAMTVFTVGYGDITPVGVAKAFVIVQTFLGYLLPAAFVVSGFANRREHGDIC